MFSDTAAVFFVLRPQFFSTNARMLYTGKNVIATTIFVKGNRYGAIKKSDALRNHENLWQKMSRERNEHCTDQGER
jgi:hypothetical protein